MLPTLTTLMLALAAPPAPAAAPDTAAQVQALEQRLADLERRLAEPKAAPAPAPAPAAEPEPEQAAELARVAVKAEALEDARDAGGLKGLKVSAWVDPAYVYNVNQERGSFQVATPVGKEGYGYFDSTFGTAGLDLQKEMDGGTRLRLTLVPARSASDIFGEGGIIHEASVSVPLGDLQTRLIAGQLPDWSGYEYLPSTQNKLVTHNLLFDFTLPMAYSGAGLELVRGKWTLKAVLANMNSSLRQAGEVVPVLAYRGDYSGGEFWGFGFAGVHGKKANLRAFDPNGDPSLNPTNDQPYSTKDTWLDLLEVDGWYTRGDVTFNAHLGAGHQKDAAVTPDPDGGALRDAKWLGVSALAAYKVTPRLELVLRGDYLLNHWNGGGLLDYGVADGANGIGPAFGGDPALGETDPEKGADRFAASLGCSYAFTLNTTLKLEYRLDGATQKVFQRQSDGSFTKYNQIAATSVVVAF